MKRSIKLLSMSALLLAGVSATVLSNSDNADARNKYKSVKVLKKQHTKLRHVRITSKDVNGSLFVNTKLTNNRGLVRAYANEDAVTTYKVKLRLKSGKKVNYTRIRKLNDGFGGQTSGYVRSSYLKTITNNNNHNNGSSSSNNSNSTSSKANPNLGYHAKISEPNTNGVGDNGLDYDISEKDILPLSQYSNTKFREEMIYQVNKLRQEKGLNPLQEDPFLTQVSEIRAKQELNSYQISHFDKKGNRKANVVANSILGYNKYDPKGNNSGGPAENVDDMQASMPGNLQDTVNSYDHANESFNGYVYQDQISNNGHRDIILSSKYTKIGVSEAIDPKTGDATTAMNFNY